LLVAITGVLWLFCKVDAPDTIVVGVNVSACGGMNEENDFWRNTPGEQDGNTSGEIFLKRIFQTIGVMD
jgi:hypothetical protein